MSVTDSDLEKLKKQVFRMLEIEEADKGSRFWPTPPWEGARAHLGRFEWIDFQANDVGRERGIYIRFNQYILGLHAVGWQWFDRGSCTYQPFQRWISP